MDPLGWRIVKLAIWKLHLILLRSFPLSFNLANQTRHAHALLISLTSLRQATLKFNSSVCFTDFYGPSTYSISAAGPTVPPAHNRKLKNKNPAPPPRSRPKKVALRHIYFKSTAPSLPRKPFRTAISQTTQAPPDHLPPDQLVN